MDISILLAQHFPPVQYTGTEYLPWPVVYEAAIIVMGGIIATLSVCVAGSWFDEVNKRLDRIERQIHLRGYDEDDDGWDDEEYD